MPVDRQRVLNRSLGAVNNQNACGRGRRPLKEKELRIALVCFGGISLAIYMHGISKEILKLVRASRALHSIADRAVRSDASFLDMVDRDDPEYDTDAIYFELLRDIGRTLELRVIVDIVAGASAGGINGTMLARALSHDLPTGRLRNLWLDHADVSELLASEARARATSKLVLKPVVWAARATGLPKSIKDQEVRRKQPAVRAVVRFKPPLSGPRMAELTAKASLRWASRAARRRPCCRRASGSICSSPSPIITVISASSRFTILRSSTSASTGMSCGFIISAGPTARSTATSSWKMRPVSHSPRARHRRFPAPFRRRKSAKSTISSLGKSAAWPHRADFIARNFEIPASPRIIDPTSACFLDGSVLNNRPFREAVSAIRSRPAYRQVDRLLSSISTPILPRRPIRRFARFRASFRR